jgi:hypothetical protein
MHTYQNVTGDGCTAVSVRRSLAVMFLVLAGSDAGTAAHAGRVTLMQSASGGAKHHVAEGGPAVQIASTLTGSLATSLTPVSCCGGAAVQLRRLAQQGAPSEVPEGTQIYMLFCVLSVCSACP